MKTLLHTSPNTFARIAGLAYVLIAIAGGFSMGYLPTIIAAPDAATTANNILNNQTLFITGIFADIVVFILELIVTTMLYMLLAPVNKTIALIAMFARLAMITVIAINTLFDITTITLLTNPAFATAFDTQQLHGLVLMFTTLEHFGVAIWQLFFTVHLLALGTLVIRSNLFPRFLGASMMLGSLGYTADSFEQIISLGTSTTSPITIALLTIVAIGEIGFGFWLLLRGMNLTVWKSQALPA
ncbi:MAG: DUF4386 domain-containing protein [Paracoccaceae bacterium]